MEKFARFICSYLYIKSNISIRYAFIIIGKQHDKLSYFYYYFILHFDQGLALFQMNVSNLF